MWVLPEFTYGLRKIKVKCLVLSCSYIAWAASGFSAWTLTFFNISRLITISVFQKNYKKFIIIGLIFVVFSIIILTIPAAIAFNIQYGNCVVLFWSQTTNNVPLMIAAFIFLFALFLYFLASIVLLPVIGLTMTIKLMQIKNNSRKLRGCVNNKGLSKGFTATDIRMLFSQIFVSNFAVIFNLPMAICSILNLGNNIFNLIYS